LADRKRTEGLGTEGISDGVASVESLSGRWLEVESTNGTLTVGLVGVIGDLENVGVLCSVLFEREGGRA
jgi:hypothetical protein